MHSQTLPHTGVDRGMAAAKLDELFEGALRDPMEAMETGNARAKTRTCSLIMLISNGLADAVEAKDAKTKAKMEVRPETKARGDTIKESLKEAIEAAGSSKKI
uniref:Uncharacterized protein n=1 Tax=Romanomermis culicivorax TaxID=13658 RepID=A0A915IBQ3_ROMCU